MKVWSVILLALSVACAVVLGISLLQGVNSPAAQICILLHAVALAYASIMYWD